MKKNINHFWYSEKQKKLLKELGNKVKMSVKIKNKRVEFTEFQENGRKNPIRKWNDYKYLGQLSDHDVVATLEIERIKA